MWGGTMRWCPTRTSVSATSAPAPAVRAVAGPRLSLALVAPARHGEPRAGPAGMGPQDARRSRGRRAGVHVHDGGMGGRRDPRSALERGPAELVATGTIHNYVRMLWGKKVIE